MVGAIRFYGKLPDTELTLYDRADGVCSSTRIDNLDFLPNCGDYEAEHRVKCHTRDRLLDTEVDLKVRVESVGFGVITIPPNSGFYSCGLTHTGRH